MTEGHDAAFARSGGEYEDMDGIPMFNEPADGLTKLEYFSAMAMQGLLATGDVHTFLDISENRGVSPTFALGMTAVDFGKALVAALNEQEKCSGSESNTDRT